MNVKIISANQEEWDTYIHRLDISYQDIYFTREYYKLCEEEESALAQMFVCEEGGQIGVYPFLKRTIMCGTIGDGYCDIETAYGYGGPLFLADDEFKIEFEQRFLGYCQNENIIAEFVRFHPLICNERFFRNNIEVSHNRKTVCIDLTQDLEDIWMKQISTQNRNTIRKCEKNNLTVELSDDYETFIEIYRETMNRVEAGEFYYFSNHYFDTIKKSRHCKLMVVKKQNHVMAAALFIGYGQYFNYHLSGSRSEDLRWAPNNIMLWEAIKYAKKQGYKYMHLGGGLSDSVDDNLFRFKGRFSHQYADFYIGKRVHNYDVYSRLIRNWESEHGIKATRLLQYRE